MRIEAEIGQQQFIFPLRHITLGKVGQWTPLCINLFTYIMRIIVVLVSANYNGIEKICKHNTMSGIQEALNVCSYVTYFYLLFLKVLTKFVHNTALFLQINWERWFLPPKRRHCIFPLREVKGFLMQDFGSQCYVSGIPLEMLPSRGVYLA